MISILQDARRDRTLITLIRVRRLHNRAVRAYPASFSLQVKWIAARLRMHRFGCRRPRVAIGRISLEASQ